MFFYIISNPKYCMLDGKPYYKIGITNDVSSKMRNSLTYCEYTYEFKSKDDAKTFVEIVKKTLCTQGKELTTYSLSELENKLKYIINKFAFNVEQIKRHPYLRYTPKKSDVINLDDLADNEKFFEWCSKNVFITTQKTF